MKSNLKKTLYFSESQYRFGVERARLLGMSFNDWVRYIISREMEDSYKETNMNKSLEEEDNFEYEEGKKYLKDLKKLNNNFPKVD